MKNLALKTLPLLGFLFFLFACGDDTSELEMNPEFTKHIAGYTSGVVSAESSIKILLTEPYTGDFTANEPLENTLFTFSPSIEGSVVWVDNQTIEFIPESRFASGESYVASFKLGEIKSVKDDLSVFKFNFTIIEQAIDVEADGLRAYDSKSIKFQQFMGNVIAADVIEEDVLNKTIDIKVNGNSVQPKWERQADRRMYRFIIDSIQRKDDAGQIVINWDGSNSGVKGVGEIDYEIPAIGDFKVTDSRVVQHPEQYVLVRFSDPLLENQDLAGIVDIRGAENMRTSVSTNELRIYPESRLIGDDYTVFISGAIKNCEGYKMGKDETFKIQFEAIKPNVRLVGNGTILPSSNGMLVPFEAVNLRAVDVRIIKVYENNVKQFFQNNNYDGQRELKRVGRLIRKKTIYLDQGKPIDFGKWNRFNLDLSEYIKVDKGAIYRVELGFRKHHSTYPCELDEDFDMDESDWDEHDDAEADKWAYVSDYWGYDYSSNDYFSGYDYYKREDPCSYSYFVNKTVSKNIFSSDIGVLAKFGDAGEVLVAVTDIVSALPKSGVNVKIYDYQQQVITELVTDNNGLARSERLKKAPFFVIADDGDQKGYLKIDDGSSLPLSRFDISGSTVKDGLKGFIYGERGVWRPGDTLFLSFILEDRESLLPENHPVIFELFNPKGQLVKREVKNQSLNGFYNFTTPTEQEYPTGNWGAKVTVGGAVFHKTIKIETVKPNRLKIKLDVPEKILSKRSNMLNANLKVNWLHGAPAKNLKADVSVEFLQAKTIFEKYKNFSFDDPAQNFYSEEKKIFEGRLNENGQVTVRAALQPQSNAPGMLKAVFTTRAFENGGDFSADQFAVPYAPYETFVGIASPELSRYGSLETDTTYSFEIATIDKHGKPKANNNLEVKIYRVEWRWWWERGSSNLANYIGRSNVRPISTQKVKTNSAGKGIARIKVGKYDWGRYLIRVTDKSGGHSTGLMTYFDWPSWMSRAGRATPDGANMLSFAADKENYKVGDQASISFPSSAGGQALISIEDGAKVKDAFWVATNKGETKIELPITPDLAPNCYVHITLLQPHSQTENDAPIRMYGVIPILVEDPATKLEPVITMPDELAPESTFSMKVKEKNGKGMTYTIAVVDEGLLDLTRFKTPSPWNHFYSREALGVKTWDVFDHVIGAYGAKVENILTIGGDGDLNPGSEKAIRFKPMVRYLGPFYLEGGKTAEHHIDIPNYIGSVRAMVVAGQNLAYGNAEKTVPVKKPLMALATLPRILGPGEKVKLPVTIFAMDKKVKNVKVEVKTNKLFTVQGAQTKQLAFNQEGDELVTFELNVADQIGKGKVEIIATGAGEKSTYEIELDVRSPNLPVTVLSDQTLEKGSSTDLTLELPGMAGTNAAKIEVSSIPAINLEKRMGYLLRYPHGCLEQTTSSAFPQLYLEEIVELTSKEKLQIKDNVVAALNKIRRHQLNSGGFAYWIGGRSASDWSTTYAGHFILEAEKKGYNLPFGLKDKWLNYQQAEARKWTNGNQWRNATLAQAYRLYSLALGGKPELSAMNRLREHRDLTPAAAWRLAAAYQIIGKGNVASQLVAGKATSIKSYRELSYSFGTAERDQAMIIETLTLMNKKSKAAELVKAIAEKLNSDRWMSTQSTAFCLKSIADFAKNESGNTVKYSYTYKGKKVTRSSKKPIDLNALAIAKNQNSVALSITNESNGVLFTKIVATGTPKAGQENDMQRDLRISVSYQDMQGNYLSVLDLDQGTDFIAKVTVSNPGVKGNYKEMVLTQIFPSGWEIHNSRMDMTSNNSNDAFDYQDIRDDRIYTYFDLRKNSSKTFTVQLHAAYVGDYYMPAVRAEAMYDEMIHALKKGEWVKVKKAGE
jgi:uncharacterized protein YfaS (alpha-2-macroglobulin family)